MRLADLTHRLRRFDPAGAFLVFSLYGAAVTCLAALVGHAVGRWSGGEAYAMTGAIYAAVAAGVPVMIAQPRTGAKRYGDILAFAGAIATAGLVGALDARVPVLGQELLIATAFVAFYIRRWGDPWSKAGLIGLTVVVSHQIIGSLVEPKPLDAVIGPALLVAGAGWLFLPVARFGRALERGAAELSEAIAAELRDPPTTRTLSRASSERVDERLSTLLKLREQADRFDSAHSAEHQARLHGAAVQTRVWENAADILADILRADRQAPHAQGLVRAVCAEVGAALTGHDADARAAASARLNALEAEAIDHAVAVGAGAREADLLAYQVIALRLALGHLLDGEAALPSPVQVPEPATKPEPATAPANGPVPPGTGSPT